MQVPRIDQSRTQNEDCAPRSAIIRQSTGVKENQTRKPF